MKKEEFNAKDVMNSKMAEAKETLNNPEKMKSFLEKIEKKLKDSPLNDVLEAIPTLVALLKSYIKKEYTEIPVGSILAIICALLYWIAPIDIIPDLTPVIGYTDDAAVLLICLTFVNADLEAYREWAKENKKETAESESDAESEETDVADEKENTAEENDIQ